MKRQKIQKPRREWLIVLIAVPVITALFIVTCSLFYLTFQKIDELKQPPNSAVKR